MPFLPDALRVPWNRVPAKAAPSTNMLFPKSDNNWYSRDSTGVDKLVGGEDTDWITMTLAGLWVHFDARTAQYRRKNGIVYFRGIVKDGTGVITTIPAGFRPQPRLFTDHHYPVVANSAFGAVRVDGSGQVDFIAGSNLYVDLISISYVAGA